MDHIAPVDSLRKQTVFTKIGTLPWAGREVCQRLASCSLAGVLLALMACGTPTAGKPTSATEAAPRPGTGTISGGLSYPGEHVPALSVYAIRIDIGRIDVHVVHTRENQQHFSIEGLEPGVYNVIAYADTDGTPAGGYTQFVVCGLRPECKDHSLVPISLQAGEKVTVSVADWYAPPGSLPNKPQI